MTTRAAASSAGTWLQLARFGPRAHGDVVMLARRCGFHVGHTDRRVLAAYIAGATKIPDPLNDKRTITDVVDRVMGDGGLVEKSIKWLNENKAPEGYSFGWYEGDFMLWSAEEWKRRLAG